MLRCWVQLLNPARALQTCCCAAQLRGARYHTGRQDDGSTKYVLSQDNRSRVIQYSVSGTPSQGFNFHKCKTRAEATHTPDDEEQKRRGILHRATTHTSRLLKSVFLPAGYPNTVGEGYWGYVAWQTVTNFAIAANAVLASTFLLYSVGLGAGAIPTAGALNWVLKDGLGQLGTLIFGKTIAHKFDIHSKSWFFLSNIMLKLATGIEIMTIAVPQYFLILGSLANSLKGLAWMANGSTRSVFNLSYARDNNIADITAKGTSQYICASMFGTVAGATICTWVGQDGSMATAWYLALTAITLYGAFATVKTIPLSTLNNTRLQLLCESYLSSISAAAAARKLQSRAQRASAFGPSSLPVSGEGGKAGDQQPANPRWDITGLSSELEGSATEYEKVFDEFLDPQVPRPVELASEDPPLPFLMGDQRLLNPAIIVGETLERMLDDTGPELVVVLLTTYQLSHAIVFPREPAVHILLHQHASPRDICQAYLQACLLRRRMRAGSTVGLAAAQHASEVEFARYEAATRRDMTSSVASSSPASSPALPLLRSFSAASKQDVPLLDGSLDTSGYDASGADPTYGDQCVVKGSSSPALAELRIVLQDTLQTAERLTSPFMNSLEAAGWKLEKVVVEAEKRRVRW